MDKCILESMIKTEIPDASVQVHDVRGDGQHFSAIVVSSSFVGMTRIQQHQKVHHALGAAIENDDLHALQLTTRAS